MKRRATGPDKLVVTAADGTFTLLDVDLTELANVVANFDTKQDEITFTTSDKLLVSSATGISESDVDNIE